MAHLAYAAMLDPGLARNLPPNMARYPQAWPPDAERALAVANSADAQFRRRFVRAAGRERPWALADLFDREPDLRSNIVDAVRDCAEVLGRLVTNAWRR
jgi:hypothetical protein